MTFLFNRTARIVVRKAGDQQKTFDGLRVSFDIRKTSSSKPNISKISVYNLNETNRKFVEQEGLKLSLIVGYKGIYGKSIEGLLFKGDITRSATKKNGPDYITTFEIGDDQVALTENSIQKSYKSGTSIKSIVKDLVKSLGVVYSDSEFDKLSNRKFLKGYSVDGKISARLDELIKSEGYYWNIQDGEFKITKEDEKNINEAVLFSKSTGLINIPSRKDKGIEFEALINTNVRPNRTVKIESENTGIDGFFKVLEVIYKGDTRQGNWLMKVEAE